MANISKMNKKQLIEHGKTLGIKLDNGMVKKTMLELIRQADKKPAKAKSTPKAKPTKKKETIVGQPVAPEPTITFKEIPQPKEKTIWEKIKGFFGV